VLTEANRVLKPGGRVILNNIYSLRLRNEAMFEDIMELIGFRVIKEYTGEVDTGKDYRSQLVTLEKRHDIDTDIQTIMDTIGKENFDGLRFSKIKSSLKDSRKIIRQFILNGQEIPIKFNPEDQAVLEEEESILAEGNETKVQFGSIESIPREEIVNRGFIRIRPAKNYLLFKKLEKGNGVVTVR